MGISGEKISNTVVSAGRFVWEKGGIAFQVITHLFFEALSFVFPVYADKLYKLWLHVNVVWLRLKAAWREDGYQAQFAELEMRCKTLEASQKLFDAQKSLLQSALASMGQASDQLSIENSRVGEALQKKILQEAELTIQIRHLDEYSTALGKQLQSLGEALTSLRNQSDQVAAENGALKSENELLKLQLAAAECRSNLDETLQEIRGQLNGQIEPNEMISSLESLLRTYKEERGRCYQMLGSSADRIPTQGIVSIASKETEEFHQVVETLILIVKMKLEEVA